MNRFLTSLLAAVSVTAFAEMPPGPVACTKITEACARMVTDGKWTPPALIRTN